MLQIHLFVESAVEIIKKNYFCPRRHTKEEVELLSWFLENCWFKFILFFKLLFSYKQFFNCKQDICVSVSCVSSRKHLCSFLTNGLQ